jgi:hypothetical protein
MARAEVLDDDDDVEFLATGPGRHQRTQGPVLDAYADDQAIECHCPVCDAEPYQWCRVTLIDGRTVIRKTPHTQRRSENSHG